MINGIPVKIARETENGTDCETVYFATFRKCPALAQIVKTITKLETESKKAERMRQISEEAIYAASNQEEVDSAGAKFDEYTSLVIDTQQKCVEAFEAFLVAGLKAAGYDDENALRISASIPVDRLKELIIKARIGSGLCDFFTEPTQSGGK